MALTVGRVLESAEVGGILGTQERGRRLCPPRLLPNVKIGRRQLYVRSAIEAKLSETEIAKPNSAD
jgi:hypothetical protein